MSPTPTSSTPSAAPAAALSLRLRTVPGRYAVAQLPADAPFPTWADGPGLCALVRASDELSVVCLQERVPSDVHAERDWICLRTVGPFDFQAAGIVHALIQPLSTQGIGVFVVCTFDGEHLLIATRDEARARTLLRAAGHLWSDSAPG